MECQKVVKLNIGGKLFVTDESTLKKESDSKLANLAKGPGDSGDAKQEYFIDRDGTHFCHILEYLRDGTIPPADVAVQVHKEAKFYGLGALVQRLEMMGPVHQMITMEKLRSEVPSYRENLDKIVNIARRRCLEKVPSKPTAEVWIGARYNQADAPFHASDHVCEFQPIFSTQDINPDNTVSLVFSGQKDAVHYIIRENLPAILQHDLRGLQFKFVVSHLISNHSTPQHCKICSEEYKEQLKSSGTTKGSLNLSSNLSDKGFGVLVYCITFTWFDKKAN